MFSRYQEANKIVNMMVLDLLLFYKENWFTIPPSIKGISDQVICTNIPEKCLLFLQ